ncbi:PREDICTED: MICOS complex subunit MIC19 isoform X1 [Trachymyrmex cornetzi]|uniref:Coiled-coil-helix-coiled-coil-helix domain-containing protein 6 n=1 Tax=Trachymyrmex cornetzi TaxID=471704 RepID=A0A151IT78_9HYME|nr:PREDICTED: MICOS complex subunit MIC19 isoform X1 [Trachymyrmex cornetzi]KYN10173.1 Coiled-coil-helix-coiled-coil-helix domain-containing protein 6 [Trachymyrmex cornetzi]
MGSGQSARKLTISNEEEVGVIKVSNAIVQRLAQGEKSKLHKPLPDAIPAAPIQHPAPSTVTAVPHASEATHEQPVYYYPELTVSALQIQQQMEEELQQQDQYWQRRLQNIEDGYQKINRVLEEEYKKAANESSVAKPGQKITDIQNTVQPCLENSNKVLKCFQDHPKETLKCSNLVEEFSNCVWNVHTHMIETRS